MDLPKIDLRLTLLVSFLAACGGALGSALWYIQVIRGEDYERLATGNRIRRATIPAPRGTIFDRGGNILADNRPGFEAAVSLSEVSDKKKLVARLSEVLEIEPERIQARLNRFRQKSFEPVRLATNIGIARATVFEERSPEGEGVEVRVSPVRNYPYGPAFVHLIGYVGQIDTRELKRLGDLGYGSQDDIGKIGVEQSYDLFLRGVGGGEQIQVNASGFRDRDPGRPGSSAREQPLSGGGSEGSIDPGRDPGGEEGGGGGPRSPQRRPAGPGQQTFIRPRPPGSSGGRGISPGDLSLIPIRPF